MCVCVCASGSQPAAGTALIVLTDVRHVTVRLECHQQPQMIEPLCCGGAPAAAGGRLT